MKSHKNIFLQFIIIFFIINISLRAQTEITGFFDLVSYQNLVTKSEHNFFINQFELDVSYAHKTHFSVGSAVAFNNQTEQMELAMAFVHYSFIDGPALHPRRKETYDHSAFLFGKFDMPFGLDYLSFASADRPTITQPLVIEKTIGGWNDIGIDFHMFNGKFKFDIWAVNGFRDGVNLGGNLRYTIIPSLEIGFSHASDFTKFKFSNEWINGVDLQLNSKVFQFQTEYLWTKGIYEGAMDSMLTSDMHHGVYFQLNTNFYELSSLPINLVIRYGAWGSDFDRDYDGIKDCQNRYTATIGYYLDENLVLRLELVSDQIEELKRENKLLLQAVVSF